VFEVEDEENRDVDTMGAGAAVMDVITLCTTDDWEETNEEVEESVVELQVADEYFGWGARRIGRG